MATAAMATVAGAEAAAGTEAAADAAAAAGRQAEVAGNDAGWVGMLWGAIRMLAYDVSRAAFVMKPLEQPEQQWLPEEADPLDAAAAAVLGRAWKQLPLKEVAPLAEALARLLCQAQHVKPLLRLAAKRQAAALAPPLQPSGGGGGVEAAVAQLLSGWLLAGMNLCCPSPGDGITRPTAPGAAAACALLQSCCKLVQHAARLQSQGAPPGALLFAASWSEAGLLLGQLLGASAVIGADWLLNHKHKVMHLAAVMAGVPRRWAGERCRFSNQGPFLCPFLCPVICCLLLLCAALAVWTGPRRCCSMRLNSQRVAAKHSTLNAWRWPALLPCPLQPGRCHRTGVGIRGACGGRLAVRRGGQRACQPALPWRV